MNMKMFIPAIVVAVVLSIVAFVGFTTLSSDVLPTDDDKIVTYIQGSSAVMTESGHAESTELIFLGDIQSVRIVEEYPHEDARYKWVMQYIEIKPTELLKGTPVLNDNGNVLLRVPGGETANVETVYEYLILSENDHVFMYLGMNDALYEPTHKIMEELNLKPYH